MLRSVKRVTLWNVPLDVVYGVVDYFEHVEEVKCEGIKDPQQVCLYVFYIPVGVVHNSKKTGRGGGGGGALTRAVGLGH